MRFITSIDEIDRRSFFNNLHTLVKTKHIDKKLYKTIASNYSYGSQFIHQEKEFNPSDVRLYVDQTLLHIEKLLEKFKELSKSEDQEKNNN